MIELFTLLSIAILFSFSTHAQNGKITGSVKDASTKGIHSATVSLLKLKDSSVAKFVATGNDGQYEFLGVADGKYFVSVSNVGYAKVASAPFEVSSSNSTINVPVLIASEQAKDLGGVT